MSTLGRRMREDELASANDSPVAATGEFQSHKDELASIKAGGAEMRSCSWEPMAATLWSTLSNELLQQIFARLPPRDITRLKCLSKKWKWSLTSRDSEFKQACAVARPKTFAMVSGGNADGFNVPVNLYDMKGNGVHWYVHQLREFRYVDHFYSGDGGWVCGVSRVEMRETPLITVLNPLDPGPSRVLPDNGLRDVELEMVQLVVDRDRRCYKVLAVGKRNGRVVAKIFSSETGVWDGELFGGLVFGHGIVLDNGIVEDDRARPCAYDSVGRELLELIDGSHPFHDRTCVHIRIGEDSSLCYALVRDHLFVLHMESCDLDTNIDDHRYCIWEYRGQKCEPHWVKLKKHRCKAFEDPPTAGSYRMSLYACKGFVLVKAENDQDEPYRQVLTWLYDMGTEKWQAIPPFADMA